VTKSVDTLILGCTHYPLLSGLLQMELGPDVVLVSSAEETAKDVYATLIRDGLERDEPRTPRHEFLATGDPGQFQRAAGVFWTHELARVDAARAEPVGGGSWS
jgi:glutamate racemase